MRKRILTNYIGVLILSSLITGVLAFYFIQSSYIDSKEEKLITNISLIESTLMEKYEADDNINFHKLAQKISSNVNSRVTFINEDGWPIADSINNSIILKSKQHTPEYRHAIKGEKYFVKRYSSEIGKKYFYLAIPPIKLGNSHIILRLGDSYDEVDHLIERFLVYLAVSTTIGILFAIIVSYVSVGKIVRPIKELTEASKLIAKGDFDNRIIVDTKDEIEELSLSFNRMDRKLKHTMNTIENRNTEMDAVLSSIQDGILALNQENKVILVNESVNNILDISEEIGTGEHISEVFSRLEEIKEIEMEVLNCTDYYREIKIKEKIISFATYPIRDIYQSQSKTGTLIIIKDMTSIRNLENMRKEFVVNVSHELRTPLTAIAGFVETLKIRDLDDKGKTKALNIIGFETERLKGLINQLLNLSKIESIKEVKQFDLIDIKDNVLEVIKLLDPQIRDSDIEIELDTGKDLNMINSDKDLFKQVLINLIENAIKYNNPRGKIRIIIWNYEEGIKLIVEDSGIGIPEEDLLRIFERFYRVDKSRSNTREGTGLGLSIVKHIVLYFGGSIGVESKIGKGTKFIVILPK